MKNERRNVSRETPAPMKQRWDWQTHCTPEELAELKANEAKRVRLQEQMYSVARAMFQIKNRATQRARLAAKADKEQRERRPYGQFRKDE